MGSEYFYSENELDNFDTNLYWLKEYTSRNASRNKLSAKPGCSSLPDFMLHASLSDEIKQKLSEPTEQSTSYNIICGIPAFPLVEKTDSTILIQQITNGSFQPLVAGCFFTSIFKAPATLFVPDDKTKKPFFEFNSDFPTDAIANDVKTILDYYLGNSKPPKIFTTITFRDGELLEYPFSSYKMRRLEYIKKGIPAQLMAKKSKDASRAIGLWLWDYIQEHGGTIIGAIRAIKEQLGLEIAALGFAASEENVFRRFYRKTEECINACEVLPFK